MNFQLTALDSEDNVVIERETKESWSISELQIYVDKCKAGLYSGEITDIAISSGRT